jgi:hypothetical protein
LAIFRHILDRHFEYLETGIPCYDLENGITWYNFFSSFRHSLDRHLILLKPAYPATNCFAIFQHSPDLLALKYVGYLETGIPCYDFLSSFRHSPLHHLSPAFEYLETGIPCYDLENGTTWYNFFFQVSATVWTGI